MKGLLFSEPMVKAWMEGRKTVTRRLMNPQPELVVGDQLQPDVWYAADKGDFAGDPDRQLKPRYRPGETVYIKETWAATHMVTDRILYKTSWPDDPRYKKDTLIKWKSPRFMPEWASRSHALIVSVRPERVWEITPEEVKKEGLIVQDFAGIGVMSLLGLTPETYMEEVALMEFQSLWETLHPGSWERNDWVWRYELKKNVED